MNGQGVQGSHRLNTQTNDQTSVHLPQRILSHRDRKKPGGWTGSGGGPKSKRGGEGGGVREGGRSPNDDGRRRAEVETHRRVTAGAMVEILRRSAEGMKAEALWRSVAKTKALWRSVAKTKVRWRSVVNVKMKALWRPATKAAWAGTHWRLAEAVWARTHWRLGWWTGSHWMPATKV